MSNENELVSNEKKLGKYWAAINKDTVIGVISMRVPKDVDFDAYREKAIGCLSMLGDVKSGELIEREGKKYFQQRLTHQNRGKSPRQPKEYLMYGHV
jgi:hypothetical protein